MKPGKLKILLTILLLLPIGKIAAQDWKNMSPEKRKSLINNLSSEDRKKAIKDIREEVILGELDIPEDKKEEFSELYQEYQDKQKQIKSNFKSSENYEELSDEEAKKQLENSFEVGQQLLDNRKAYSQKFMRIVKPQKVLKMYQTEGVMRRKMMDQNTSRSGSSNTRGNATSNRSGRR